MGNSTTKIAKIPTQYFTTDYQFSPPKTPTELYKELSVVKGVNLKTIQGFEKNRISIFATQIKLDRPTILFVHGNGTDIFYLAPFLLELERGVDANVVTFDYPGFGLSTGKPTHENAFRSLEATINYLITLEIDLTKLFLIGRSFGAKLIFDFLEFYEWTTPVMIISPSNLVNPALLTEISAPISIVSGSSDTNTTPEHVNKIATALAISPIWVNANHQNILDRLDFDLIRKFLGYDI